MFRVKRVGVMSLAKIQALLVGGVMVVFGVFFVLAGLLMLFIGDSPETAMFAIGIGILGPPLYMLLGFIIGGLQALIYNLVAAIVGGLEIDLERSVAVGRSESDSLSHYDEG